MYAWQLFMVWIHQNSDLVRNKSFLRKEKIYICSPAFCIQIVETYVASLNAVHSHLLLLLHNQQLHPCYYFTIQLKFSSKFIETLSLHGKCKKGRGRGRGRKKEIPLSWILLPYPLPLSMLVAQARNSQLKLKNFHVTLLN